MALFQTQKLQCHGWWAKTRTLKLDRLTEQRQMHRQWGEAWAGSEAQGLGMR